jgi:hypothetical protein
MNQAPKHAFNIIKFLLGLTLIGGSASFFYTTYQRVNETPTVTLPPVFQEMQGDFGIVKRIRITVPEGSFQIIRQGDTWIMPERGNFLVSNEAIATFATDMKYLKVLNQFSNDPSKFDILGVGESKEFGEGTTVELFDIRDNIITARHIATKSNLVFVRKLGQPEVFSAQGHWPKIERKSAWLDFEFLNVDDAEIETVTIRPAKGAIFTIAPVEGGSFTLNGHRSESINNIARAITNWQPIDVIDRFRIEAPTIVSHETKTMSGLVIKAALKRHFGVFWLVVDANATENASEATRQRASQISLITSKWAFAISQPDADLLKQKQSQLAMRGTLQ